jgi:hypothetical protein
MNVHSSPLRGTVLTCRLTYTRIDFTEDLTEQSVPYALKPGRGVSLAALIPSHNKAEVLELSDCCKRPIDFWTISRNNTSGMS